jgi:amino acid transporter
MRSSLPVRAPPPDRLSTLGLAAATFFIVSGGPFGLEEIVLGQGYRGAALLLAVVPLVWSLPVALLVGELGAALPATGGYYVWVRRALGPFWGLQEAWLSLAVGVVSVAIYPTLLATYLGRFWPAVAGLDPFQPGWWLAMALVAAGTAWNVSGIREVGRSSAVMTVLILLPFVALVGLAVALLPAGGLVTARAALAAPSPEGASALATGLLVAMWNLMGFDNASTFAGEVRDPGRSYPRAMVAATAVIVVAYLLPVVAAAASGVPASEWTAGAWVQVAERLGGRSLAAATTVAGAVSATGMFVASLLALSRLPVALAEDGWLPRWLGARSASTHAPVRAVVLGGLATAACIGIGLRQLIELNVVLYGAALILELVALVALRVREPELPRPFRVPGGLAAAVLLAAVPTALLVLAAWVGRDEPGPGGLSAVQLTGLLALVGPAWWLVGARLRAPGRASGRSPG